MCNLLLQCSNDGHFPTIRFMTAEGTSKNRIVSPGRIMHFYNAPPDSTTESLNEVPEFGYQALLELPFFLTSCSCLPKRMPSLRVQSSSSLKVWCALIEVPLLSTFCLQEGKAAQV